MNVVGLRFRPKLGADKPKTEKHRVTRQLEILALRSFELADRVARGELDFIEAVDFAYSAAVWAGLASAIDASNLIDRNKSGAPTGDDIVQEVIAGAFANARQAE